MHYIFCDISVEPKSKIGFGAYLVLNDLTEEIHDKNIRLVELVDTSSTKAEIETFITALNSIPNDTSDLIIYTDSQCLEGILDRRKRLEKKNFQGRGGELNNAELYKEIYKLYDKLHFKIVKVRGHAKVNEQNKYEKIFSFVDKASRRALREIIN